MADLMDAVNAGADAADLLGCALPDRFRAVYTLRDEVGIFEGHEDKDVRRSIHVGEVAMPEAAPDEVVVAVMAATVNFNTVWTAIFEPVPTFVFLARQGPWHDLPYHVMGSDAAGVVVRVGAGVRRWKAGDRVVISAAVLDEQDPASYEDPLASEGSLAWGFETNFGSFADYTVVKATQLVRKPAHLTWEEAAASTLCAATAYRMLVGDHGARMKQGDVVLVWGGTGGLGSYAIQFVRNGGGIPVAVVSSPEKAELVRRHGCEHVIDRSRLDLGDLLRPKAWRVLGEEVRRQVGEDPRIVFEYLGRETFAASVYVAAKTGRIVTCGSSTGYRHEYDNRFLWMNGKRIIGSHGFSYTDAVQTNRLISRGLIHPTLSRVFPLADTAEATRAVQLNQHVGKVGILCGASREGLGVDDPALRERIGEERLGLFRQR